MATGLKTVTYWFPEMDSWVDNSLTTWTGINGQNSITMDLPETGYKKFVSVVGNLLYQDATITANNISRRQLELSLGGGSFFGINNVQTLTASAEQKWPAFTVDFTTGFTRFWTGAQMACQARLLTDNAAAAPLSRSATLELKLTYLYDDAEPVQLKTVKYPLAMPYGSLAATFPARPIEVIPNLSGWLPESGISIKQATVVIQGNDEQAGAVDVAMAIQVGGQRISGAAVGTINTPMALLHEQALNSSCWYRHVWQPTGFLNGNGTNDFYMWTNAATKFAHPQGYIDITYSFSGEPTTTVLNSLILPMGFDSPMGGTTANQAQYSNRPLWIQEPAPIQLKQSALMLYYEQAAPIAGLFGQVGTGRFGTFVSTATTVAGGCGLMMRAESGIGSLSRGRNVLSAGLYRTDASNLGYNISSYWIMNYYSSKHPSGMRVHNKSTCVNFLSHANLAAAPTRVLLPTGIDIPEDERFLNSIGFNYQYLSNTASNPAGATIQLARSSGEGGPSWESIYSDIGGTDALVGLRQCWAGARDVFRRFPNDAEGGSRLGVDVFRAYRTALPSSATSFDNLDFWITYHSIVYPIQGTISNSNGGNVYININRALNNELIYSGIVVGDNSFYYPWYDNTAPVYVTAYEDSTHFAISPNQMANTGVYFNLSLSTPTSSGSSAGGFFGSA